MSTSTEQVVAALRESLKETDRLRRQNRRLLLAAREPLAIVGMSCRFPGNVSSPRSFWELLEAGTDAISRFPRDRGWNLQELYDPDRTEAPSGRSYVRDGGFLHDAADFDAEFFRISPREALVTDPQQRLLLEAVWEAIEDAGMDPLSLRGSDTGVFAGAMYQDYGLGLQSYVGARQAQQEVDVLVGSTNSVITGRVAYALGLEGPAITVDTACSSSLVAMHLACQSLRAGESSLALAGGVTVLSTPGVFVEFSRQQALAPDGRCKAFAEGADGTSLAEGVGVVVLERLSDARRNRHPVLALVRGSAINQDGASNGMMAPNGLSQRQLIRQALASANLKPSAIDAVEAHGTGTALGDPIEAGALIATYGRDRPEGRPLWLGSAKSNIGHTQAAAGMAGVIKMVMAMRNGLLPRTLHVDSPSNKVNWGEGEVSLLTDTLPWGRNGEPRRAGVSSFGVSGTNAHVILEEGDSAHELSFVHNANGARVTESNVQEAPRQRKTSGEGSAADVSARDAGAMDVSAPRSGEELRDTHSDEEVRDSGGDEVSQDDRTGAIFDLGVVPWVLSGRGVEGLTGQAERLTDFVSAERDLTPIDIGSSLAGRPVLGGRGLVVGFDRDELLAGVRALASGASSSGVIRGVVPTGGAGGIVFVFPGQGSQWPGMALELTESSPVFAERLHECGEALAPFVDWSLEDVLAGAPGAPPLERVDVVQPALFAVMVALAGLWDACGVRPDAVVGHSQGEIAAACVVGALSLGDAARLIALRSRALTALAGRGGMVSIAAELADVRARIEPFGNRISIAAVNGPGAVVVSGEVQALEELLAICAEDQLRARTIPVNYAAHSTHVEEIREALLEGCAGIAPGSSTVPFYSSVSAGPLDAGALDAEYWYRNLRDTVEFERVTKTLLEAGFSTFIEISPHPVLTLGMQETVDALAGAPVGQASDGSPSNGSAPTRVNEAANFTPSEIDHDRQRFEQVTILGSLRRGEGGVRRQLSSLGEAWVQGASVDWEKVLAGNEARHVKLPTYAFQRRRYWLEAPLENGMGVLAAGQAPADHPLLGAAVTSAQGKGLLFTGSLSLSTHPWLADHAVLGSVLLPGTAFLDLALHAGSAVGCGLVSELVLQAPLIFQEREAVQIQLVVDEPDEQGARAVNIYSRPRQAEGEPITTNEEAWTCHAGGTLLPDDRAGDASESNQSMDLLLGEWPPPGAERLDLDDLYENLADLGLEYGPVFQGLRAAWRLAEQVLVEVALPEQQQRSASSFGIHPALLDAALHGIAAAILDEHAESDYAGVSLPFSWSQARLFGTGAASLRACLSGAGTDTLSLALADELGAPLGSVGSLLVRALSAEQLDGMRGRDREGLFSLNWVTVSPAAHIEHERWAVLDANDDGWAADRLRYTDLDALRGAIDAGMAAPELVLVRYRARALSAGSFTSADGKTRPDVAAVADEETSTVEVLGTTDVLDVAHRTAHEALAFTQAFLADERLRDSRLVVLTSGAVATQAGQSTPGLTTAPVWGLIRSAQSEHPGRLTLVDLDEDPGSWETLPAALASGESQLAIREAIAFAPRLVRARANGALTPPAGISQWRLEVGSTGTLEDLRLAPNPRADEPLAQGQVRVAVRAAGVNFRDVVTSLGLVPLRGDWDTIGSDGAGVVLEVGAGVEELVAGDRVMGVLSGGFGPVALSDHRLLVRMPTDWSFTRAASVPGAFLTAYYALVDLAKLRPGERLLVHAAAGGVGMAAVQLAIHAGAEVFATASPGKHGVLRSLGLDETHIASSRDPAFRDKFLETTAGEGMDVVLNSLARELVDASLELLPRGGRFIEMGKTDIRDPERISAEHPGVAYRAFDLLDAGAERVQEMLTELVELFEQGALETLPIRAWDVRRAPEAFRFMSQARHVGKIVLTLPAPFADPGATVLITGGTGQLGGLLARHLVRAHGVSSLLLASRRGEQAPGAAELEAELNGMGAQVRIVACDVTDREQLDRLIKSVPDEQPLGAVVHAAGALDDGVLETLTSERVSRVLAPKLDAAWCLHELTEHMNLQSFVLFSSAAGTLGGPGQANYAAANTFLDSLAAHRQAHGLPATSIAWGWWEQPSEMTAHLRDVDLARLRSTGFEAFSSEEGLELFDAALSSGEALTVPLRLDEAKISAGARAGALPVLLHGLARTSPRSTARSASGWLAKRLAGVTGDERRRLALDAIRAEVAAVLGYDSGAAIDVKLAFKDLGFDSLLAVELRNRLNGATGLRLPATLVFDYPTPTALASHLLSMIDGARTKRVAPTVARVAVEDPVAIVGMSCRYPGGANSPQALWNMVASGLDAISPFPTDRGWDVERLYDPTSARSGTSCIREAGFLYDMAEFDAEFFGISPREANAMDPQQRLALETAWEALEDAGVDPLSLRESETGVFMGITALAYGERPPLDREGTAGFLATGNAASVLSGRVAYTLGLEGPAITVDTACSSSLVALHLACSSLRSGESKLALVGGVMVLASPGPFVEFTRQGGLARDARCKSFADSADGTNWGEGVGMLVVERLSDAQRLGHEVLAVVRASAVNQDGASNGLTAPNGPSQQRVIAQALANAGLSPADVDAVEAHGTGTTLGDPIEAQALLASYGQNRSPERPLWLGSIKSNMGHTQAAAGVAGVIKMTMALRHELLPRTLHVDAPTSQVDWSTGAVSLLTHEVPWKRNGRPRRAGVSSFGISGTNAHIILEEAPECEEEAARAEGPAGKGPDRAEESGATETPTPDRHEPTDLPAGVWMLSGKGRHALRAHAARLHQFVGGQNDPRAGDVGLSLARRSALENRAVVIGSTEAELLDGLAALSEGELTANVIEGATPDAAGRLAFMFTGQGAQRPGMGSELYRSLPNFTTALDEVCAKLDVHLGGSLLEVMFAAPDTDAARLLDQTMFTQAGLFALEVALFRLLESWGVRADYLIGHSIGELTAAYAAGVFSLDDACMLVAARGRLMGELQVGGAMIAVQATAEEALESLSGSEDRVTLAAVNGPSSVVLSGDEDAVLELAHAWRRRERKVKRLRVSHAFHSQRMEGMLESFAEVARSVSFASPSLPVISNLTGEPASEEFCSPQYWVRQVRDTVRFADGVAWLADQGVSNFLELGPDGVLTAMTLDCLGERAQPARGWEATTVMASGRSETLTLTRALAELWAGGGSVDWQTVLAQPGTRNVRLPTYPFQRKRHWMESGSAAEATDDSRFAQAGDTGFLEAIEHEDLDGLLDMLNIDGEDQRSSLRALLPSLSAWRLRNRERSTVDGWRYRVEWKPTTIAPASSLSARWLVIIPRACASDEWILQLLARLEQRGITVLGVEIQASDDTRGCLELRLRELLEALPEDYELNGVLSLLTADEGRDGIHGEVTRGLAATVALTQALSDVDVGAPLWMVTRAAVSVGPSDRLVSPPQAQAWGLGLAIGLEYPQSWGGVIDLPQELDERVATLTVDALSEGGKEDQLAVRSAGVFARRLAHAAVVRDVPHSPWTMGAGTVLVTGATGALGGHVARWLAHAGVERLLLVSRRGAAAQGADLLRDELSELGVEVEFAACDVANHAQLATVIDSLPPESPLSAVFHAAGSGVTGPIEAMSVEDLQQALSAKAQGALNLHALTEHLQLSAFVLFSSISGVLGSAQQGAYAAANACLDALALRRSALGLPATSVAWGPWGGGGMAAAGDGQAAEALRRRGLDCMAPELAIKALEGALRGGETVVALADIRWETYAPIFTLARPRPLIEDLPEVRALSRGELEAADESVAGELRRQLRDAPAEQRGELLIKLVRAEVARVLGHSSSETVEFERPFKDLGFDSLLAVELRHRLSGVTGLDLPATLVFDYPTPAAVADHLAEELVGGARETPIMDELTRLGQKIESLVDARELTAARSHLTALLARLDGAQESATGHGDLATRLQSASDEEIFGFIDQELG
jgi:acyl transferase domain-containing protein/D-arabinose 1-dehydrogenase-like Zn-dependent alcohol dehydrogenase/acyl carrier protein